MGGAVRDAAANVALRQRQRPRRCPWVGRDIVSGMPRRSCTATTRHRPRRCPWVGRGIVYSSRVSDVWRPLSLSPYFSSDPSLHALPGGRKFCPLCRPLKFSQAWRPPRAKRAVPRRSPVSLRSPVRPPPFALAQPARRSCQVFVPDMIKLFSLKEEKAKEASAGAASNPKIPPGLIRMQKGECRCHRLPLHARR